MKKLILLQGAPGCGKSTMAQMLKEHYEQERDDVGFLTAKIYSADDYWYEVVNPHQPEIYSWNEELSGKNHVWNQRKVARDMASGGPDIIIIDNTNTTRKEAKPYIVLATIFDYEVEAIRVDPGVEVCVARQPSRGEDRRVPEEIVRAMHARMQSLLDVEGE